MCLATPSHDETTDQLAKRQKHNVEEQKKYQKALKDAREALVNGLPRAEAQEKVASHLFMSLGDEGRRQLLQKRPGIQITDLDLHALMHECEAIFVKLSNVTIERVNLIRRVQQPNETLEHFHFALVDLAKLCDLGHLTEELVRDFFIAQINVPELQQKFSTDPMTPEQVYRQALAHERGLQTQKQIQLTNTNGPPSKSRSTTNCAQPTTDEKPITEPSVQAVSTSRPPRGQPRGTDLRRKPANKSRPPPPARPSTTSSRAPSLQSGSTRPSNLTRNSNRPRIVDQYGRELFFRCGHLWAPGHAAQCPARSAQCRKCQRLDHFTHAPRDAHNQVRVIQPMEPSDDDPLDLDPYVPDAYPESDDYDDYSVFKISPTDR